MPDSADDFVITRTFDASRDRLFKAWSKRDDLLKWWGPKGFTIETCAIDLTPGGVFHYGMQTPVGTVMWGKWVFREIQAPERLVFVASFSDEAGGVTRHPWAPEWPLETLSTLSFAEADGQTTMTMRGTPINPTETERAVFVGAHGQMQQGWGGTLDQLEEHLKG